MLPPPSSRFRADLQSVEERSLPGAVEPEDENAHLPRAEEVAEVAHEAAHRDAAAVAPLTSKMSFFICSPFTKERWFLASNMFRVMMWAMLTSMTGQSNREAALLLRHCSWHGQAVVLGRPKRSLLLHEKSTHLRFWASAKSYKIPTLND